MGTHHPMELGAMLGKQGFLLLALQLLLLLQPHAPTHCKVAARRLQKNEPILMSYNPQSQQSSSALTCAVNSLAIKHWAKQGVSLNSYTGTLVRAATDWAALTSMTGLQID